MRRNSDPETSHESAAASVETASKLQDRIVEIARAAGPRGISLSEAEEAIPSHKAASITPRFSELVRNGNLVRVPIGMGKPTGRYPAGRPQYLTRFDENTKRNVLLHWLPEFAPSAQENQQDEQAGA